MFSFVGVADATAYKRDYFKHWSDIDRNGLDTRQDELIRQSFKPQPVTYSSHVPLKILTASWVCPYSGEEFVTPEELDIDHIVPLAWAWKHGADKWTPEMRERFANDHENLLVVSASMNQSKGAKGPDEWLPSNLSFVPTYIIKFMTICDMFGLEYDKEKYINMIVKYRMFDKGINPNIIK